MKKLRGIFPFNRGVGKLVARRSLLGVLTLLRVSELGKPHKGAKSHGVVGEVWRENQGITHVTVLQYRVGEKPAHEAGCCWGGKLVVGERRVSGDSPLVAVVTVGKVLSHVRGRQVVAVVTTPDVTLAVIPV